MSKRQSSSKRGGQVGPRIVRAWFDTIINPLLLFLEREQQLLHARNWTWRFRPASLEAVREVQAYLDRDAWPNLEQLISLQPDLKRAQEKHDKQVVVLKDRCADLHRRLRTTEYLPRVFRFFTSEEHLKTVGKDIRDLFGAYPESDRLDVVAEYVVNNTGELPAFYTTAPPWNRYRARFLEVLQHAALREHWEAAVAAGQTLLVHSQRLSELLKTTRLKLSLEHDTPYVVRTGQSTST